MNGDATPADAALTAATEAINRAADTIRQIDDPEAEFETAGRLIDLSRKTLQAGGALRAHAAARIHQAENLSIAALGRRLGVSKGRAQQLLDAAKESDAPEASPSKPE